MTRGALIVVSGVPGVGKTTVTADDVAATFVVLTCSDLGQHRRRLEGRRRDLTNVREPSWSEVLARSRRYEPWSGEYLDTAHLSVTDVVDEVCERIRTE